MFGKVLIANRGAIACRIIRTLQAMGIEAVAVYTRADAGSLHVRAADHARCIGEGPAGESYLDPQRLFDVARETNAEAVHPGYGFLSENPAFASACAEQGLAFIGPTPEQLRRFGLKHTARALAQASAVPLVPGSELLADAHQAREQAEHIGFPVMLKSTAGGGGIGMQLCHDADELTAAYESVRRLGRSHFGDAGLFLEKYIGYARHIEVQIFGDGAGEVLALGERDCSVQRRNQKVIEETPAPNLPQATRERLHEAAVALGRSVSYRSAGTVEFIYDGESEDFYFLEVNTRLQVEHGVTEQVWGVDLVQWMVALAAGELPPLAALHTTLAPRGHAIQARLYAEDPARGFRPCAGLLSHASFPRGEGLRVDTWVEAGTQVSPFYDPMLGKLIAWGENRERARLRLVDALAHTRLAGIETNRSYLGVILAHELFVRGMAYTRCLDALPPVADGIEVLDGGTQTTVQDVPGRVGYWDVGVPPSGPMDDLSFRLGNRLLGNPPEAAGLELTMNGPALCFHTATGVALTGAPMAAELDGAPVPWWAPVEVGAGAVLRIGAVQGAGARAYLTVRGGIDVAPYLGSRATFTLGGFGGHAGRALRAGDVLHLAGAPQVALPASLPAALRPEITRRWLLRVIYGPHGAPEFFTAEDIETFFATDWEVHYNSSRTGIRLIGPKPRWARADGGEAGLHPSNIHDNAYAVGAVDFTGDMPVILGPDGPSLGGFVCPATVIRAERWKLGQLKAGDRVRFQPVALQDAAALEPQRLAAIADLRAWGGGVARAVPDTTVLRAVQAGDPYAALAYRPAGDDYLLVEFGPAELDIGLRARAHALMHWLQARHVSGLLELTPGIRSLQLHYDPALLPLAALMALLQEAEQALGGMENLEVPSRIVHLPLSWDDPATRLAIERYTQSVRADAPWCPSNIEFIRRINGLDSMEEVRRVVFDARYLVLGLGDVYLGAPVATPLDPRHRLVTTKYNPARTWTPENAVGIGGAYLCVYGMEGPGGYQFIGRTVQMWNRFRQTAEFEEGKPWLLRFFDQIQFFPVTSAELERIREEFPLGRYRLRIEETTFSLRAYRAFLAAHDADIAGFRARQRQAFADERARWARDGTTLATVAEALEQTGIEEPLPAAAVAIDSPVAGSVWQVLVRPGERVSAGQPVVVLESMKMEVAVEACHDGTVVQVLCEPGGQVAAGRRLLVLQSE